VREAQGLEDWLKAQAWEGIVWADRGVEKRGDWFGREEEICIQGYGVVKSSHNRLMW
jgi:hypothetical protein